MTLLLKRLLAFAVDYVIILLYAGILFAISSLFVDAQGLNSSNSYDPLTGQILGFLTLALPVILYGFFFECSQFKATPGKKIFNLRVEITSANLKRSIFIRNILKYLPWEIAHIGVHMMFYFRSIQEDLPIWVWLLVIIPQIIVLVYLISLFFTSGAQSIYDKIAMTQIKIRQK